MTTITDLSQALSDLAAHSGRLAEREADLARRVADLDHREAAAAAAIERATAERTSSALWAEATAARDQHWRTMVALQLEQLNPQSPTATVLRRLVEMATGEG